MSDAYEQLKVLLREGARLGSVCNLLQWDQETMMPARAASARAESLASLSRVVHERFTDPRVGELLGRCEADTELMQDADEAANVREIRRDYEKATKIPAELVAEINETGSRAMEAWKQARADNDFDSFRPWLERQFELNRNKAECYGAPDGGELYDALVDDYEAGMTGSELERIFAPLRDELVPLIREITESGEAPTAVLDRTPVPIERQIAMNRLVLDHIGFDGQAGRLDVSVHPFSSGVGPHDTRITTRYSEENWSDALSSTLHEAGHGLYEQGLPKEERWGQPLSEPLGLGIHESQSRLWENHVGRSRAFWSWLLPQARQLFGDALAGIDVDEAFRAVNIVRPHLIRIESDEATYNLHIMLRFDLERAMLRGDLSVADLPGAWSDRVRDDLGLAVPDDAMGCLQDVHWSMGAIGYFPTYTLGNLYGAQFWEAIQQSLPDLQNEIAAGRFASLLGWLREQIHASSRRVPAADLCRQLTGRELDHTALMRHLSGKFRRVYGLDGKRTVASS